MPELFDAVSSQTHLQVRRRNYGVKWCSGGWSSQEKASVDKVLKQPSFGCQNLGMMERTRNTSNVSRRESLSIMESIWRCQCYHDSCAVIHKYQWTLTLFWVLGLKPIMVSQAHVVPAWCLRCSLYRVLAFKSQVESLLVSNTTSLWVTALVSWLSYWV